MKHLALSSLFLSALLLPLSPLRAQQARPTCVADSRECMIASAQAYLDGLVTRDGSKVPLAVNVRRTLNAHAAIEGEDTVRKAIGAAPPMIGYRNTRFIVDTAQHEIVYYTLLRLENDSFGPNRNAGPFTLHLAQRFKVEHGLIEEIEAIDSPEMGTTDGVSGWPDRPPK